MKRIRLFLIALDDYLNSYSYYDDETEETIIDGDENDCYEYLMTVQQFHFIGEKRVREYIHIAFTNYKVFFNLVSAYKAISG